MPKQDSQELIIFVEYNFRQLEGCEILFSAPAGHKLKTTKDKEEHYKPWVITDEGKIQSIKDFRHSLVPAKVTARQIRLQLLKLGILKQVEAAVKSEGNEAVRIEWEYALDIERDNPLFINMASQLGLDEEAMDNLFLEAEKL